MILRQLFDSASYTYTYLLGDELSGEACLIDPVLEQTERNLKMIDELQLKLELAVDTHVHADHITGLGELRDRTGCTTMFGAEGGVACATASFVGGTILNVGALELKCLFTPGHTGESYCFLLNQDGQQYLFSGDTLLIGGTGRTDFQNGSPQRLFESLRRLIQLPDSTIVYPGHDYNGNTSSTIGEERKHNPRLLMDAKEFVEYMNNLDLPDPKMMDIAVPANQACGEIKLAVKEQ